MWSGLPSFHLDLFHHLISQLLEHLFSWPWWMWYPFSSIQVLVQQSLPRLVAFPVSPFTWHPSQWPPLLYRINDELLLSTLNTHHSIHSFWFTFTILASASYEPQHLFVKIFFSFIGWVQVSKTHTLGLLQPKNICSLAKGCTTLYL